MDHDKIPVVEVPLHINSMSAIEAWNAALKAHEHLIAWSLFWDDGRSIELTMLDEVTGDPL